MAVLAVQATSEAGIIPDDLTASLVAGAGANQFPNGGLLMFRVVATAGGVTITFVNQTKQSGNAGPNKAVVLAANDEKIIGPINPALFNDSDGLVHVTVSNVANVADFQAFSTPRFA